MVLIHQLSLHLEPTYKPLKAPQCGNNWVITTAIIGLRSALDLQVNPKPLTLNPRHLAHEADDPKVEMPWEPQKLSNHKAPKASTSLKTVEIGFWVWGSQMISPKFVCFLPFRTH